MGVLTLICRYYDYNFMFLAFSKTICRRLYITKREIQNSSKVTSVLNSAFVGEGVEKMLQLGHI